MLKSVRGIFTATLLAGCALAATPALADDAPTSDITISGNAALVTQYRFRGVGLSGGDIAIQGGIDVSHSSGFYVGTWGSSLANSDNSVLLNDGTGVIQSYDVGGYGAAEIDLYGGWSGNITPGLTGDIGVIYYYYPDATNRTALSVAPAVPTQYPTFSGYAKYPTDYVEFYGSLGYSFGPVDTTVGVAYAPKQNSLGNTDNFYAYLDVSSGIPNTPVTLNGHVGYTDGFLTFTTNSKAWDWSVGADLAINEHLSVGVSYVGVEHDGPKIKDVTGDAVVGTLSVSF